MGHEASSWLGHGGGNSVDGSYAMKSRDITRNRMENEGGVEYFNKVLVRGSSA